MHAEVFKLEVKSVDKIQTLILPSRLSTDLQRILENNSEYVFERLIKSCLIYQVALIIFSQVSKSSMTSDRFVNNRQLLNGISQANSSLGSTSKHLVSCDDIKTLLPEQYKSKLSPILFLKKYRNVKDEIFDSSHGRIRESFFVELVGRCITIVGGQFNQQIFKDSVFENLLSKSPNSYTGSMK